MRVSTLAAVVAATLLAVGTFGCGDELPPPQTPPPPPAAPPPPPPAPEPPPPPPAPPKKTLAELQMAAGQTMNEAFAAGDAKKLAALYAENAVMKMAGAPDIAGRANIEKNLSEFFASFGKIKTGASRVFAKNDVLVSEWTMNATHSGEFMGIKATEKPVGWVGASVMWFADDGTIKEEHIYWNAAVVAPQVGASKEKNRGIPALPAQPLMVAPGVAADEEANVAAVQSLNRAIEGKDEKGLTALFGDDVTWDDITLPEATKGKPAVQKYFKGLSVAFPDAKLATQHSWGVGNWVVEEGTYAGTNNGPLFGAKPTKKAMTIHELNVYELDKSHKILHAVTYGNDLEMSSQLAPAKPAAKPAAPAAKPAAPAAKPAAPAAKPAAPAAKPAPKK